MILRGIDSPTNLTPSGIVNYFLILVPSWSPSITNTYEKNLKKAMVGTIMATFMVYLNMILRLNP
jgi:hypothetical protein